MKIAENGNCTGCMACLNVCPVGAIEEREDEKGFYSPFINTDKCINCKMCVKTCPANSEHITFNKPQTAYLGKNATEIRKISSSGGFFKALSDEILKQGGTVYGAQFDQALDVEHGRADNSTDSLKFCGSKYVESRMGDTYAKVMQDLKSDKYVYFSGTACQVSGLLNYLNAKKCDTEKLITQDFICHGVGSPKFYKDYLKDFEKKFHSKAVGFNFRGKPRPGKFQNIIIDFENGKRYVAVSTNQDVYYYHFLNNLSLRTTCFSCQYSRVERVSDITLADCFNVKENDYVDDSLGISYIQINSNKGQELFDKVDYVKDIKEIDYSKYIQPNMKKPSSPNTNYEAFWNDYNRNGYHSATKKYGNRNIKNAIKRIIIYILNMTRLDNVIKTIRKRK